MTINKLKGFGFFRKTFKGKGILKFQDGTTVAAKFTLAQIASVDLVFTADIDLPQWELDNDKEIDTLSGRLADGRHVSVNGLFVKQIETGSSHNKTCLTGYASNFTFGAPEFESNASVSFEVTNFLFNGTKSGGSLLELQLDDRVVILQQVSDYEKVETELRFQKRVQVTCVATTTIANKAELGDVIQVIDRLCDAMTVARSTLISWTSYEIKVDNTDAVFSCYRNSITRGYSGSGVIYSTNVENTKNFLQTAYLHHRRLSDHYRVTQLARAYTETRSGGFIESRSMLIGVLTEYIASIQAGLDNRESFLPADIFESRWDDFSSHVKTLLMGTYPETKQNYIPTMINIIKGFNRRPFSWKLNHLIKKLAVNVVHGEIEKIVATRNNLAHQGRFSENEAPVAQYLRMQHFIDRLMLRLFDYHGPYYDIENNRINEV